MSKLKTSKEKGFTLIENVISLAVLTITLLGVVQLMAIAVRQVALARFETMAAVIGQTKLEELRAVYNNELETGTDSSDLAAGSHGPTTVTLAAPAHSSMGDSSFEVSWAVIESGTRKIVSVTIEPQVSNELNSGNFSLTAIFVP
jgi:prepilin-type N-terminal cleavage/methylation domain-containing protein